MCDKRKAGFAWPKDGIADACKRAEMLQCHNCTDI